MAVKKKKPDPEKNTVKKGGKTTPFKKLLDTKKAKKKK